MTREEAIKYLENSIAIGKDDASRHHNEVIEFIINALKEVEDCISRKAAQAKIKNICEKYMLSYEDGERKPATGGSAYALGHAFDDLPPATQQETYTSIPFLLHKEFGCPLDECVKAYEEAIEHLRSKSKLKG